MTLSTISIGDSGGDPWREFLSPAKEKTRQKTVCLCLFFLVSLCVAVFLCFVINTYIKYISLFLFLFSCLCLCLSVCLSVSLSLNLATKVQLRRSILKVYE